MAIFTNSLRGLRLDFPDERLITNRRCESGARKEPMVSESPPSGQIEHCWDRRALTV